MAAGARGMLGFVSWIFLAGALVLMFFVVLSGVKDVSPLNKIYFLQADTSKINGARSISQWTYFYVCGADNQDCGSATAALPFGYAWAGGNNMGVPSDLLGDHGNGTTSTYYFYMWRFGWVFYIMALFFGVLAVFTGLISCTRLGSGISSLMTAIATFWMTLATVLMTVEFVKARNVFNDNGMSAQIGSYAFGFSWAAVVCLFIASTLFFGGCLTGRSSGDNTRSRGIFRRNRSTRSRGSFIDNESQRRVIKDETY